MQRRFVQLLLSNRVRNIPRYQLPTSAYFCSTTENVSQTNQSWKKPISEKRTNFSDLDPEEFGSLSSTPTTRVTVNELLDKLPVEGGDHEEFDVIDEEGKKVRRRLEYYEDLVEKLLSQKKVVEALDVLETRMLKKDRVKPGFRIHNLLINGCAKVGYTEKAFKLYKSMKDRKIKRTPSTYTGLFNACANSLFPGTALKKLNLLRQNLADTGVELNMINYHAMIKAYARLKDTHAAFLVADEMVNKGFSLNYETCSFLLQACISDTECGLRHALLIWHKMRQKKIKPVIYHYNLLLRCIHQCGLGDESELKDVIKSIVQINRYVPIGAEDGKEMRLAIDGKTERDNGTEKMKIRWQKRATSVEESKNTEELAEKEPSQISPTADTNNEHVSIKNHESPKMKSDRRAEIGLVENRPNLLAKNPHLGSIIAVKMVETPSDKLLLLGGYKTILEQMEADQVAPNIKTFTQLLEVMPPSVEAENHLMEEMKKHKVDVDITFCNVLMKQRATRNDYKGARDVLSLIQSEYLQPDIVTFGVMAMSCSKQHEAEELIQNMSTFGYRLNMEILGAMLRIALSHNNFRYALFILQLTDRIGLKPSQQFMDFLEISEKKMAELLRRKKRKDMKIPQYLHDPQYLENYRMFKDFYTTWKKNVTVFVPPHPLEQFKKSSKNVSGTEETDDVAGAEETEDEPQMMEKKTKYRRSKRNVEEGRVYPKKFSYNQDENDYGRKFKSKKFVSRRKTNAPREEYDEDEKEYVNNMPSDDDEGRKEKYRS